MKISLVVRTLNEQAYLGELLASAGSQQRAVGCDDVEIVVVDSGSLDTTLDIAMSHGCRITHIDKQRFTFGRSLNEGCEFATGDILVFISGHCVPTDEHWLENLVRPVLSGEADYTYGRQIGRAPTKFSEDQLFRKYFPATSAIPQEGFFVNNANAAISRAAWEQYRFDEELTGLEDMELAKRLVADGGKVGYCADACVYHIHDESWHQTRRRYEREAYALQSIMPEVHVSGFDAFRYVVAGVFHDATEALRRGLFLKEVAGILKFRVAQFTGTYRGNHIHRTISRQRKESYFYPKPAA